MKTAKIGNLVLESGKVKIAVPIMGELEEDVLSGAVIVQAEKPDIVEWRADSFWKNKDENRVGQIIETARKLRIYLEDIPLLFTIRTKNEGGEADISLKEYEGILGEMADKRLADAFDLELFTFDGHEDELKRLINRIKSKNEAVIMSSHDFNATPPVEEMVNRLKLMEEAGADVAKIAVMPADRSDVMNLINATFIADQSLSIPVITMSMGEQGKITRLMGKITGSCLTFASRGKASAPGQIPVEKLRELL